MFLRATSAILFSTISALAADVPGLPRATAPVLRGFEPSDSGFVTLPGAAPSAPATVADERKEFTPPPPPALPEPQLTAPPAANLALPKSTKLPNSIVDESRSGLRRLPKPFLPPDFERDSAIYCQKRIGEWTQPDAYNLFGKHLRQRVASTDGKDAGGLIYAFADPTGRYREIELDFAADTGLLRSVFVYPWQMTWQDCRKMWGTHVSSTPANKGRTFYSFQDRNLDVLVDSAGKVVSLGLY